jgi:hypothetical protein
VEPKAKLEPKEPLEPKENRVFRVLAVKLVILENKV